VARADVLQRLRSAQLKATSLTDQSRMLTEAAQHAVETATHLVDEARRERGSATLTVTKVRDTGHLRSFELEGVIDDVPVEAVSLDGVLVCDPLLRSHAEVIVALGESIALGRFGKREPASLDGPPAVVLATLARAMKVTQLRVGFTAGGVSRFSS
jgi:hypothetical protein